jgi:transcriptional regulator with XRE-family HTH domain
VDEIERERFREEVTQVFAENLKRERKAAGLTQEALAEKADMHRTHVGYLERGIRTPELPTIQQLTKALGISASRLVDRHDPDGNPADQPQVLPGSG